MKQFLITCLSYLLALAISLVVVIGIAYLIFINYKPFMESLK